VRYFEIIYSILIKNNPKTMKTYLLLISLLLISFLSINGSYAQKQQQDSLNQKRITFYSKVLAAGQDTAARVVAIMDTYKEGVKKVVADATLSEANRRVGIDALIAEKNKKLARLLTPAQLDKIIPTTERKKTQPGK
jgi:hypothetical protein